MLGESVTVRIMERSLTYSEDLPGEIKKKGWDVYSCRFILCSCFGFDMNRIRKEEDNKLYMYKGLTTKK